MKILKKFLVLCIILILTPNVGFAKSVVSLDGIVVHTYTDTITSYSYKTTNSNYIMNLRPTADHIIIKHRMINPAGHDVSDWRWTKGGERESLPNKGVKGYNYRLRMVRSGAAPIDEQIFGSWSADEY